MPTNMWSDPPNGMFFMRMEIEGQGFGLGRDEFDGAFSPLRGSTRCAGG